MASAFQILPAKPPPDVPPIDGSTGRWHPLWEQWLNSVELILRELHSKEIAGSIP